MGWKHGLYWQAFLWNNKDEASLKWVMRKTDYLDNFFKRFSYKVAEKVWKLDRVDRECEIKEGFFFFFFEMKAFLQLFLLNTNSFLKNLFIFYLFIFGCVGSSLPHADFL